MKENKKSSLIDNGDPNIRNEYFRWLCSIVGHLDYYSLLLHELHAREFYYTINEDENRSKDGKFLRYIFGVDIGLEDSEKILSGPCSILEMLIALAGRADGASSIGLNFKKDGIARRYFWIMLNNLKLKDEVDECYDPIEVNHIIDRWMFREFKENGDGGLFPLKHPKKDQREIEIYMQLESYLIEHETIDFDE